MAVSIRTWDGETTSCRIGLTKHFSVSKPKPLPHFFLTRLANYRSWSSELHSRGCRFPWEANVSQVSESHHRARLHCHYGRFSGLCCCRGANGRPAKIAPAASRYRDGLFPFLYNRTRIHSRTRLPSYAKLIRSRPIHSSQLGERSTRERRQLCTPSQHTNHSLQRPVWHWQRNGLQSECFLRQRAWNHDANLQPTWSNDGSTERNNTWRPFAH